MNSKPLWARNKTSCGFGRWLIIFSGILGWVVGDHSAQTFRPLWNAIGFWQCYFWVSDGNPVYPGFIPAGDQIVSKTYMTRVEGENTRLRHYLARLHRKTLCYSKSVEMLKHSIRLLIHYLKFGMSLFLPNSSHHLPTPPNDSSRFLESFNSCKFQSLSSQRKS